VEKKFYEAAFKQTNRRGEKKGRAHSIKDKKAVFHRLSRQANRALATSELFLGFMNFVSTLIV